MYRQSEKNLLSCNTSSTCPDNMVNFGPLTAEIVSLFWGTQVISKGFRVLATLLYGTAVVGMSQTLRRLTQGTTYIRQGGYHVGLAHISSLFFDYRQAQERQTCKRQIMTLWSVAWSRRGPHIRHNYLSSPPLPHYCHRV